MTNKKCPCIIIFFTSPGCGLIMLTMFFLSRTPPLLLGRFPEPRGSLLTWLPWRRRRLRFMSLMLLLSSVFLPRWPRSLSSDPPPDDILFRRQRTPVAQRDHQSIGQPSEHRSLWPCGRLYKDSVCLLRLTHTLVVFSLPLSLLFPLFLFSLIVFLPLNFKAPFKSVLGSPHVH